MTNGEKAREIADIIVKASNERAELNDYHDVKQSALDMAEWKDRQFKEYLENTLIRLDGYVNDCLEEGNDTSAALYVARADTIRMVINEFFKRNNYDNR